LTYSFSYCWNYICLSVFFFFLALIGKGPGFLKIVLQRKYSNYKYEFCQLSNPHTYWQVVQIGLYLQNTDKQTEHT